MYGGDVLCLQSDNISTNIWLSNGVSAFASSCLYGYGSTVIEQNAIETFFKPPSIWVRYVDDVYSIVETNQIALFHVTTSTLFPLPSNLLKNLNLKVLCHSWMLL